jgi:hypothetical protein
MESLMAYEIRPGQGSAFANEDKKEDWHADFRGKVLLPDGKTHYLDITKKVTKDGKTWLAVKVGNQVAAPAPVYSAAHDAAKVNGYQPVADLDDSIPF